MSKERTVYGAYAIVDGKRVEIKDAKTYPEALRLLQLKIDAIKAAKNGGKQ